MINTLACGKPAGETEHRSFIGQAGRLIALTCIRETMNDDAWLADVVRDSVRYGDCRVACANHAPKLLRSALV
jgi:hypothetical protein